ncbi:MAG: hypothetical protein JEZ05_03120 [Tenericutes bacterium]|nr:hypothetical protein [Mycoplasmatota bacterium]
MNKLKKAISFKGNLDKKNYFEGWYYKLVSKDKMTTLAFIPGISLNKEKSHSFIQIILNQEKVDGSHNLFTEFLIFEKDDFKYDKKDVTLSIQNSIFSLDKIKVNFDDKKISVNGEVSISDLVPIHTSFLSPSIMGFFSYIPLMECYHAVVSMNHNLQGFIKINDLNIDFNGGKGYIEKDYGSSFPDKYIWIQTNHFKDDSTSLMFSYATIPFLGMKFKGLIANLVHKDKEYRFATYNFSKIKILEKEENHLLIEVKKRNYKLVIEAWNYEVKSLASPKNGLMNQTIKEGLSGRVKLRLYYKNNIILEDTGKQAGIEIMM